MDSLVKLQVLKILSAVTPATVSWQLVLKCKLCSYTYERNSRSGISVKQKREPDVIKITGERKIPDEERLYVFVYFYFVFFHGLL